MDTVGRGHARARSSDKPLYFLGLVHAIRSTRSLGHTVLVCACLWVAGLVLKRGSVTSLALGVTTHLVLDGVLDLTTGAGLAYVLHWTTWPLHRLPLTDVSSSVLDYTSHRLTERPVLLAELAGLLLVAARVWPRAAPVRGDG